MRSLVPTSMSWMVRMSRMCHSFPLKPNRRMGGGEDDMRDDERVLLGKRRKGRPAAAVGGGGGDPTELFLLDDKQKIEEDEEEETKLMLGVEEWEDEDDRIMRHEMKVLRQTEEDKAVELAEELARLKINEIFKSSILVNVLEYENPSSLFIHIFPQVSPRSEVVTLCRDILGNSFEAAAHAATFLKQNPSVTLQDLTVQLRDLKTMIEANPRTTGLNSQMIGVCVTVTAIIASIDRLVEGDRLKCLADILLFISVLGHPIHFPLLLRFVWRRTFNPDLAHAVGLVTSIADFNLLAFNRAERKVFMPRAIRTAIRVCFAERITASLPYFAAHLLEVRTKSDLDHFIHFTEMKQVNSAFGNNPSVNFLLNTLFQTVSSKEEATALANHGVALARAANNMFVRRSLLFRASLVLESYYGVDSPVLVPVLMELFLAYEGCLRVETKEAFEIFCRIAQIRLREVVQLGRKHIVAHNKVRLAQMYKEYPYDFYIPGVVSLFCNLLDEAIEAFKEEELDSVPIGFAHLDQYIIRQWGITHAHASSVPNMNRGVAELEEAVRILRLHFSQTTIDHVEPSSVRFRLAEALTFRCRELVQAGRKEEAVEKYNELINYVEKELIARHVMTRVSFLPSLVPLCIDLNLKQEAEKLIRLCLPEKQSYSISKIDTLLTSWVELSRLGPKFRMVPEVAQLMLQTFSLIQQMMATLKTAEEKKLVLEKYAPKLMAIEGNLRRSGLSRVGKYREDAWMKPMTACLAWSIECRCSDLAAFFWESIFRFHSLNQKHLQELHKFVIESVQILTIPELLTPDLVANVIRTIAKFESEEGVQPELTETVLKLNDLVTSVPHLRSEDHIQNWALTMVAAHIRN